jgi:hypothetical protein
VSIIRFKRGTTGPTGLTLGEPAWDYVNNRFFIGVTSDAIWVGAQIDGSTGLGTSQLKIPTQNAVKQYVDARSGVVSVNGQTGAVTISVSGGGVSSFNGLTGDVQGVSSVNGATGAITNVARINEGNTFTVRQVMNAGATMTTLYVSNGITFNGTRFELKNNSSPTIIGTNTSTNNLVLRGNNSLATTPADGIINLRGGDLDLPTYGEIDLSAGSGRVNINTGTFGVTANQTLSGTLNVSGLGSFAAGISGTNGITFNNATVYIVNSGAVDPLFVQHSTSGSVKIATTGQARQGSIRFGNNATSTNNNFMQSLDGTLTFYQGFSSTGSNMLNFNATTLNVSPTITGATFSGLIRSTAGICANAGVTVGAHVSSESGYRITSGAIRTLTGTTYTFLTTDDGKIITSSNSSNQIFTIPTGLPVGFNCTVIQLGNAPVGFTGAFGMTLNSFAGKTFTAGPHAAVSIIEYATNIVNISGGLTT